MPRHLHPPFPTNQTSEQREVRDPSPTSSENHQNVPPAPRRAEDPMVELMAKIVEQMGRLSADQNLRPRDQDLEPDEELWEDATGSRLNRPQRAKRYSRGHRPSRRNRRRRVSSSPSSYSEGLYKRKPSEEPSRPKRQPSRTPKVTSRVEKHRPGRSGGNSSPRLGPFSLRAALGLHL